MNYGRSKNLLIGEIENSNLRIQTDFDNNYALDSSCRLILQEFQTFVFSFKKN